MIASTTKLIAALAATVALLNANIASAGNHGNGGSSNRSSSVSKLSGSTFKQSGSSSTSTSISHNPTKILGGNVSTTSTVKKGIDPGKVMSGNILSSNSGTSSVPGKKGFDPGKVLNGNILSGTKPIKDPVKNPCKDDWKKFCHSNNFCYPYYFGCNYPTYGCYDYCTPTYTCSYSEPITLVENIGPARTPVAVGSILMVNGQAFGPQPGGARLRVGGMAMPIEVIEWTPVGVKVRLPQVEIGGSTPAEIEVLRVDGSLAAKSPVDLIPAGQFALGR